MKSSGTCIGSRHDLTHTHVSSTHSGFSENGVPHTSHWFNVILPMNIVYLLAGTPFSDISHKQCSIPSLIPSYWLVIRILACDNMLNVFSGMIEESHHQNWGKLNTHRPFYAQICTGHHCGSSPRPPARQLRKWGERLEPVLRSPLKQETRF